MVLGNLSQAVIVAGLTGVVHSYDCLGAGGDFFLDPWNYMDLTTEENIGIKGFDELNAISLTLEEIEDLRKAALDPYVALRDFYFKSRKKKIKESISLALRFGLIE